MFLNGVETEVVPMNRPLSDVSLFHHCNGCLHFALERQQHFVVSWVGINIKITFIQVIKGKNCI